MDLLRKDPLPHDYDGDNDFKGDATNWQSKYNITEVSPNFWVGGQIISKRMMDTLESLGIEGVICVAEEDAAETAKRCKKCGVKCFLVMMTDTEDQPVPDYRDFLATWEWYEDLYRKALYHDRPFPKIYVHCHAGLHRGPTMAAFLLAKLTCTSLKDALDYVEARRPVIRVHDRPGLKGAAKHALKMLHPESEEGEED